MRCWIIGVVVSLTALVGCTQTDISTPVAFDATSTPSVAFSLPDMMCEEGCAATVKEILSRQPGVKEVQVDFDAKKATVAIEEGRFDAQQAIAALVDKGFDHSALVNDGTVVKPQSAPAGAN